MKSDVALYRLASARTGDKGNRLNVAVVCHDPAFYPVLAEALTAERMAAHFAARQPGKVVRYDLPKLSAFNFVLDGVLEGGVNASLGHDGHGKALSFHVLTIVVSIDDALLAHADAASAVGAVPVHVVSEFQKAT
jgi:hypothetical protein